MQAIDKVLNTLLYILLTPFVLFILFLLFVMVAPTSLLMDIGDWLNAK